MNRTFNIRIVYFKTNGNFYTEDRTEWFQEGSSSTCDMFGVRNYIRQCRRDRRLPGLNGDWEGPILIDCDDGYPVLILGD